MPVEEANANTRSRAPKGHFSGLKKAILFASDGVGTACFIFPSFSELSTSVFHSTPSSSPALCNF